MIYLVLVHQSPPMLAILLERLQDSNNHFVIHVDAKEDIHPFKNAVRDIGNCHFIQNRYESTWGSFALVEATLEAMSYVRNVLRKRQRIILLSGADFPIRNNQFINDFLAKDKDAIYMEYDRVPREEWYLGGIHRFPFYDQVSKDIHFYGGSQWFSIPAKVVTIIFGFLKINPNFLAYFRHVRIADESFFQTLLLNCGHPYIVANIRNENLHFILWESPFIHPQTLTMIHYEKVKNSKRLFGRKFSLAESRELMSRLDEDRCFLRLRKRR